MIPEVECGSVDGIRVLRCDAPFGRYAAGLAFRVGRFDEALPEAGVTHLIEHLTLRRHHQARYHFNAQVTGAFTTFIADSGDPADLTDFVAAVCHGLAADHREAVEQEKRVLRTEAASRGGPGALGACLGERFGARGPGVAAYQEYGLHGLSWPRIEAWRRQWFTAANAVLWISGPLPPGLRIGLPPGAPGPVRPAAPLAGLRLPGFTVTPGGGLGLSLVSQRSVAASVTLDVLERRLTQALRHEHGVSYGVSGSTEWLDPGHVHAWVHADALPDQMAMAAHTLFSVFEALAEEGAGPAEIDDYGRRLCEAYESPGGGPSALQQLAQRALGGLPLTQPAQTLNAVREVTGRAVGAAAAGLREQAIVAVPRVVPAIEGRMPRLPRWSADRVEGQDVTALRDDLTLTCGYAGLTLTSGPDQRVTVRYADLAALLCWRNGKRGLVGGDGFTIVLDPDQWPDGAALVAAVEGWAPPPLRVALDSPGPAGPSRPRPGPEPGTAAGPASEPARPPRIVRRVHWRVRLARGLWVLILVTGAFSVAGGDVGGGIGFLVAGLIGLLLLDAAIRRDLVRMLRRR